MIKSNTHLALALALQGTPCRALVDGAIAEVEGSSLIPDPAVTCSPLDFTTPRLAEPIITVEVLSPSDDAGRKLALYLRIPSLRHFLMIEQERRQVVHHERRDDLGGAFLTNIAPPDPLPWTRQGSRSRSRRCTTACPSIARRASRGRSGREGRMSARASLGELLLGIEGLALLRLASGRTPQPAAPGERDARPARAQTRPPSWRRRSPPPSMNWTKATRCGRRPTTSRGACSRSSTR